MVASNQTINRLFTEVPALTHCMLVLLLLSIDCFLFYSVPLINVLFFIFVLKKTAMFLLDCGVTRGMMLKDCIFFL